MRLRRFFNKAIWLFVYKVPWKPLLIWGPWVFILGILLFYGIENWRGKRALDHVLAEAKKEGYSLDCQDYAPEINDTPSNLASHSIFDKAQNKTLNKTKHLMKMGRAQLWKNPFTKLQRIEMERHLMRTTEPTRKSSHKKRPRLDADPHRGAQSA